MTTILEAIKAQDESAEGTTIAEALGGGTTIVEALTGSDEGEGGDEGEGSNEGAKEGE